MAKRHPLQKILFPLLLPLSLLYGAAGTLRRRLMHQGRIPVWKAPVPCISVGNISWGGTGKTPVTDWLLSWADSQDLHAAVLTRGYGAHPPHPAFIAGPGCTPAECGDEPLMMALRHPHATIVVDPDRNRGGRSLEKHLPDIFILDDGFQHLSTARDLDLVLLDKDDVRLTPLPGGQPSNWGSIIPAGTWREPEGALADAGAYLIKVETEEWPAIVPALKKRLKTHPRPVFAFRLVPQSLHTLTGETPLPASTIEGAYSFVCGIGDPVQAIRTVTNFMGRDPEHIQTFPDHHDFHRSLEQIAAPGLPIICTGKDAVKLAGLNLPVPCFSLEVKAHFFASLSAEEIAGNQEYEAPEFARWWQDWWENHR